jgi:menaquinone-dependent protoporphyrinogen oxidase
MSSSAYATKHGSTREVAEAIAARLRERGLDADLRTAAEIRTVDDYAAVVLGGSIYIGRWHSDARALLKRQRKALAKVPLFVFAMGPKSLADEDVASARAQL